MNLIRVLRELIAIELSKTTLGDDTHYFVESRDNIDGGLKQALAHLSKMLALNNDRNANKWSREIILHLANVNESALWKKWSYEKKRNKWHEVGNDLELVYSGMRKRFEANREYDDLNGTKNQTPMPELSNNLKAKISSHWDMLFDEFIEDSEVEFINSLKR
jgi:hypothetical protein